PGLRGLPPTDALRYRLAGPARGRLTLRPSGTEPKLKAYLEVVLPVTGEVGEARERAEEHLAELKGAGAELFRAGERAPGGRCGGGRGAPLGGNAGPHRSAHPPAVGASAGPAPRACAGERFRTGREAGAGAGRCGEAPSAVRSVAGRGPVPPRPRSP